MQTYEIHYMGKDGVDRTLSTGWTFSEGWIVVKELEKKGIKISLVTPWIKPS